MSPLHAPPRKVLLALWPMLLIIVIAIAWTLLRPDAPVVSLPAGSVPIPTPSTPSTSTTPPWTYGPQDARFSLVEYADLECPYCQAHFALLKPWVDANPDINWQWRHLPIPEHEPAATQQARLAECAGETAGQSGFWDALEWVFQNTRSNGAGIPADKTYPAMTPALQACLESQRPDAVIQAQTLEAMSEHISATPTFKLLDRQSGRSLMLHGPIEGDALLSAMDFLAAPVEATAQSPEHSADLLSEPR